MNMLSSILQYRQRNYFVALALVFTLSSCGTGVNLFSKSQDVQLGQQMAQQIAADPAHYPVLNDPTLTSYVQSIEDRIVQSPNVVNKDFHYKITIINDDNTVNAFTIPAGGIYVYTGLLKFVDNEATLAGILAHETTHADHRHATRNMTQQYGLQTLAAIALGQNGGLLTQIVANLGTSLTMLKFSRDDEREADQGSFDDLNQLPGKPWYPGAVIYFLQKAVAQSKSQPSKFDQLFATHPIDQERITNVQANLTKNNIPAPTEAQLNSATYQRYKSTVR